ncbi:MAG: hypothetical protein KF678_13735 [Phycisphaeraceae bacterium]|nr:hypothetical protein [Phycisphaeraceae bacterium]
MIPKPKPVLARQLGPSRPEVPPDYGESLFWSLMDQMGARVGTISLRDELIGAIRSGRYAEALLRALLHDRQYRQEMGPADPPRSDPPRSEPPRAEPPRGGWEAD